MKSDWVGWDIGGAHVKAAEINSAGEMIAVVQHTCPLWKGMDQLYNVVRSIVRDLNVPHASHAITMTGELVDLFADRDDGVRQIIDAMTALLPDRKILVFAGKSGFLRTDQIKSSHFQDIASANWLASATLAARSIGNGLFVDIGSTTTDILALKEGQVVAEGYTDYQRLLSQELVYTGIVRTAVMAVAQTAMDKGREIGVMAEYFATMADVYRVTGELNEHHDQTETADGAEKTVIASARRLSRMLGCDFYPNDLPRWQCFAEAIKAQQLNKIQRSCVHVSTRQGLASDSPIIGAGTGRFLIRQLAPLLQRPYLDFSEIVSTRIFPTGMTAADCAPAVAVAYLAGQWHDTK